ncbi:MAG TPA: PIN domain-containing protein, partial [Verrucomicrobiae bacterium]
PKTATAGAKRRSNGIARRAMSYADTSFLSSCYLDDVHTADARQYLERHKPRLPFVFLHWPEMARVIAAKSPAPNDDWEGLKTDVMSGDKLYVCALDADRVARRAAGLLLNFSPRWPKLRAFDSMHVAAAIEGGFKTFLSFDTNSYQRVLAHTQKLSVWPALTNAEKSRLR